MLSKYNLIQILLRVTLIVINSLALAFLYFNSQNYVIITNLFLLIILQSWLLSRYLNKTNKNIQYFLESYNNENPVQLSSKKFKSVYNKNIYDQLEEINKKVRNAEKELAKQLSYIKAVTKNIPGGLITIFENGKVDFYSKSVLNLINKRSINSINDFTEYPDLFQTLNLIKPGERKIVKINIDNELKILSFSCSEIKSDDTRTRIITFENIKSELDENEIQSWQKLIRVLTHEMMNSFSPIISANESLGMLINSVELEGGKVISDKELIKIKKLEQGIGIINDRSKGIINFVEKYRQLTKLPKLVCRKTLVSKLFENTIVLHAELLNQKNINCRTEITPNELSVFADQQLVMQALINLFKNAIEALDDIEKPQIILKANLNNDNKTVISVIDNGCGILKENFNEIFIPFFTTKEEGSGIGLSLSKQIMHLHKGEIQIKQKKDETEFLLIF